MRPSYSTATVCEPRRRLSRTRAYDARREKTMNESPQTPEPPRPRVVRAHQRRLLRRGRRHGLLEQRLWRPAVEPSPRRRPRRREPPAVLLGWVPCAVALALVCSIFALRWRRHSRAKEWIQLTVFGFLSALSLSNFYPFDDATGTSSYRVLSMHFSVDGNFERHTENLPVGGLVCYAGPESEIPEGYVHRRRSKLVEVPLPRAVRLDRHAVRRRRVVVSHPRSPRHPPTTGARRNRPGTTSS